MLAWKWGPFALPGNQSTKEGCVKTYCPEARELLSNPFYKTAREGYEKDRFSVR